MNLNEVEKHVKFDLIFSLLIYIGLFLCLLLSLIVILATPAKALTSTDLTNLGIQAGQHCTNHPNNTFCAAAINQSGSGNPCGNGDARCYLAINNVYDYNVMSLNFKLNTSINADSKVTITLKGTNFDNVPYYCSMTGDSVSGCVANRTSSTSMNINFTTKSSQMVYPEFDVYTNSGFNSGKSFKITSVVLYENPVSSGGGSSGGDTIINNNFDTQEIINNNNVNAEETQNVIENGVYSIITELANRCNNLISPNLFVAAMYSEANGQLVDKSSITTINNLDVNSGTINFSTTEEWWGISNTDYIPIDNYTYYLNFNTNLQNYMIDIYYYDSNKSYISYSQWWNLNNNISFTPPVSAKYMRIGFSSNLYGNNLYISNLRINSNNGPFCPYGSTDSKLNAISGGISDMNQDINNGFWDLGNALNFNCSNILEPYGSFPKTSHNVTLKLADYGFVVNGIPDMSSGDISYTIFDKSLEAGTYSINGITGSGRYTFQLAVYKNNSILRYVQASDYSFTLSETSQIKFVLFVNSQYGTFDNLILPYQLVKGSTFSNYCAYGSGGSITDYAQQQTDLQKQQNDYLMDDTDPSINNSEINNVIGEVQVQDPLNYLLTLPLNLLTKLNTVISSGTCSRASFGELYGTEIYLPCINFENYLGSSLWGTIDTIVGIGLLVVILKKFYDTISNILSLGKEEEIRKGMELPTPMEFLAQILGGGK